MIGSLGPKALNDESFEGIRVGYTFNLKTPRFRLTASCDIQKPDLKGQSIHIDDVGN